MYWNIIHITSTIQKRKLRRSLSSLQTEREANFQSFNLWRSKIHQASVQSQLSDECTISCLGLADFAIKPKWLKMVKFVETNKLIAILFYKAKRTSRIQLREALSSRGAFSNSCNYLSIQSTNTFIQIRRMINSPCNFYKLLMVEFWHRPSETTTHTWVWKVYNTQHKLVYIVA